MARKTKAELETERQAERARRMLAAAEAYPTRLMAALELATTENNYELTVRNGMFSLQNRNSSRILALSLTFTYTENSQNALETLEWDMELAAEERAEAERKRTVRATALAKLTAEERELLDL